MRTTAILAAALGALVTLLGAAPPAAAGPRDRLAGPVTPTRYDLHLVPDAEALTFSGEVGIDLTVSAPVRSLTLNAAGLTFDRVRLDGVAPASVRLDKTHDLATLAFAAAVPAGSHRLEIAYDGKIGRSTFGFFAMDYRSPAGARRTLATNFEPAGARNLLPCWDQPDRKAVFAVTLDAPADRMAISNMPAVHSEPLPGDRVRVTFAPSPKMSTYLLFVGVGDWERIHTQVDGVDVGVVVARGETDRARYALEQAVRLLHWYNGYFAVPFPLPKLDLVVAPGQIEGGSMENWGSILYSQEHLLFDPKSGTEADRRMVFLVVAHEMAHQWFGDLVTMRWWDNLWLNEGFARWMQTYVADALHPDWKTGLQAQAIFEQGKRADAETSTHPVLQPIDTVEQAAQAFDHITYDKGAAVITMINAYMGEDRFREGVRRYMRAHAFGNTVDTDLWSIMQSAAGKPILKIEADFTRQAGLPLVRATPGASGLLLAEGRFEADPAAAKTARGHWILPLAVTPPGEPAQHLLLTGEARLPAGPGAVVNSGQTGYARVLYAPAAFDALLARAPDLPPVDQLGLINDSLALGLAEAAPASRALALIARLPASGDPTVWRRAVKTLVEIDGDYGPGAARTAYRRFARATLAPLSRRLTDAPIAGEDPALALLRSDVLVALGAFDDPEVIAWARARWNDPGADAETRRAALTIHAGQAEGPAFDALLDRAAAIPDPLEKVRLYDALAATADPAAASRLIAVALSGAMPPGSNVPVLIILAQRHPDLVWTEAVPHLEDRKAAIVDSWKTAGEIASRSLAPARAGEFRAYVAAHVPASGRRALLGYADKVAENARVAADVIPEIERWIADRS